MKLIKFSILLLLTNLSLALDWTQWLTLSTTTARGTLAITGAVAGWAPSVVERFYDNCWQNGLMPNTKYYIPLRQCAKTLTRVVSELCIGASALGAITGFWKRDENVISYAPGFSPVTIDFKNKLAKREEDVTFNVSDGTIITMKSCALGEQYEDSTFYSNLMAPRLNDTATPLSLMQINPEGKLALHIVKPHNSVQNSKRDFTISSNEYSSAGSVILECQYTFGDASSAYEASNDWANTFEAAGDGHMMHWRYYSLHGYNGNDSRMKCCYKIYDHTETVNGWRGWDDVWSSF